MSSTFNTTKVNNKRCTRDRFKGYEHLISSIKNIEEYFCFDFGNSQFDLKGPYGSSEFYQFFSIRMRGCYDDIDGKEKCLSPNLVETILQDLFIDLRVLNTNIIHDKENPVNQELLGQRIPVSNSIFRRIYFKLNTIDYTTDYGYLFESQETIHINQFSNYYVDSDFKTFNDPSNKGYYKVFSVLNIINGESKTFYKRTYMKAQTLLANIGGIIKGITVIAQILNYLISNRLLNVELCNEIHVKLHEIIQNKSEKKEEISINKKERERIDKFQLKVNKIINHYDDCDENTIKLSYHESFLPLICFCNKKKKNLILSNLKLVKSNLSINNLLKKLQEFEAIKRCILGENELRSFEEIFDKTNFHRNISKFKNNHNINIDGSKVGIKSNNENQLFNQFMMNIQ